MECQEILARLKSDDNEVLREAAYAAGESACVEAVPLLAELLKSHNLGVQEAADQALRFIGGSETVQSVIPLLRSDEAPVRNLSMDILRAVGAQDFKNLSKLIHDEDADIRIFASDILGSTASLLAVEPLCEALLRDPEVNVRYQAAVSLGNLAFHEAAKCLNKALNDEEWVQFAVIEALIKIRDESSVGALVKALDKSTDLVASMVVDALGELGNFKAVPLLLRRMESSPTALRNKIVKAIINILGGKSLTLLSGTDREKLRAYLLVALSDDEEEIQDAAVLGLGWVGGEAGSAAILNLAKDISPDSERERVEAAVEALVNIGYNDALVGGLRSDDPAVAHLGVQVLCRIGGEEAVTAMIGAFWDKPVELQREMAAALAEIAGPSAVPFFREVLERCVEIEPIKYALYFLGEKIGDRDSEELLASFMEHPEDEIKEAALEACINRGYPGMSERFMAMTGSEDPVQRMMGVYALGRLGRAEFKDVLIAAIGDEIPDIRKVALGAVESVCDDDAGLLEIVTGALGDESREVRQTAVEIIGRRPLDMALPYLKGALDDEDDWVSIRAVNALGRSGDREALPVLLPLLVTGRKIVMLNVIEALGEIGGQSAFRALLDILGSDDPDLVAGAEKAVESIREKGQEES